MIMSFLQNIKSKLDSRKYYRCDRTVEVNAKDLLELVHHFERLDNDARAEYHNRLPVNHDLISKHGICTQCGELRSHHISEPIASCNCGSSEWYQLTPHMQLQQKYAEALDKIKFFERWVEDMRSRREKVSIHQS